MKELWKKGMQTVPREISGCRWWWGCYSVFMADCEWGNRLQRKTITRSWPLSNFDYSFHGCRYQFMAICFNWLTLWTFLFLPERWKLNLKQTLMKTWTLGKEIKSFRPCLNSYGYLAFHQVPRCSPSNLHQQRSWDSVIRDTTQFVAFFLQVQYLIRHVVYLSVKCLLLSSLFVKLSYQRTYMDRFERLNVAPLCAICARPLTGT